MHINVYDVFYSQFSHHVSPAIATIISVILSQTYKRTKVGSCVVVTPQQLNLL
jgi:hypothetical protein